jgi:hypothetical protein
VLRVDPWPNRKIATIDQGRTLGLTHNLGGAGIACTVSILKRSDA